MPKIIRKDRSAIETQRFTQYEDDSSASSPSPPPPPISRSNKREDIVVTEEIPENICMEMKALMENYISHKNEIDHLAKQRRSKIKESSHILEGIHIFMRRYNLTEIFLEDHKFTVENTVKKKPLKKDTMKDIVSHIVKNKRVVNKIYDTASKVTATCNQKKVKCSKL